ncbi:unnamed protein product [Dicrocoelium dendriticum]|nr:unnamed protein product [Dicrocoelium dendriticum]
MVGLLKRAFGQIDPSNFRLLLNAFLRPHLEFAIHAWSPSLLKDQRILEAPQRRATKLVRGLKHLDYPQRLQCLGLYSLKYRCLLGDLILVFMILSNPGHPCRHLLTLHQSGSHLRGHPLRLTHQHSRLNCRRHYLALRICRPWNALPADLVLAPTVADFKTRLDCHLAELHRDIPQFNCILLQRISFFFSSTYFLSKAVSEGVVGCLALSRRAFCLNAT